MTRTAMQADAHTASLFDDHADPAASAPLQLEPGAAVLRGFALAQVQSLQQDLQAVLAAAPLRHLVTPGGRTMSVAMSNCGALGWVSDASGYRYTPTDPLCGQRWPAMPASFRALAVAAAARAGYEGFAPDACLVNRYAPGARLSLHQDRDERRLGQPIVSVSLGLPAVFLWGGPQRGDRTRRVPLAHGDVVVWGGPARLHFHGVMPLAEGEHPFMGACRINLTFRCAG
ncbi:DNA oxidative demethylase AlkB [Xenophilus arseniciresistens]|uniref:DNA oxidative demethylase AlkB n=1 Tax=Xenophilus arseniciresistens TaxID=1283306 RepID=A0AAE3N7I2_9BURK|nr:DNA oxidative demethylase AlkB [Xenophilus arseniciresistens]MDA7416313.1 DNA oxidative demethylase AlkB [Xenophilus arseniciresistens]